MQRAAVPRASLRSRAFYTYSPKATISFCSRLSTLSSFTVLCPAHLYRTSESSVSFRGLEAQVNGNSAQKAAKSFFQNYVNFARLRVLWSLEQFEIFPESPAPKPSQPGIEHAQLQPLELTVKCYTQVFPG